VTAKKEIKHPDKQVSTGAYSAAVEADGWVFVSGQGPVNMQTGEVERGSVEDETKLTLSHCQKILEAAGCSKHDVVRSTVHLADVLDFDQFNAVYREFFQGVDVLPARTTVQSRMIGDIKVEIDMTARKSG